MGSRKEQTYPTVPSKILPFGRSYRPVSVGGVPGEVIDGKTGILVPPKDSKAIADAVLSLLADREKMKQMGVTGRERIKKYFAVEGCVNMTSNVYLDVLET